MNTQSETTTSSILAEIGSFAERENATRSHVRTLAERIETSLRDAIEALASAGAARVASSATHAVALAHVTTEVWANPAWAMRNRSESGGDARAIERESADFAAEQVMTNVVPARQAPYRADVIIRSAGAIVHAEVLMVTGVAGCATECSFGVACLTADSHTVEDLEDKARNHRGSGAGSVVAAWVNRVIDGEVCQGPHPIGEEPDPMAWAERWGRIMLRYACDGP